MLTGMQVSSPHKRWRARSPDEIVWAHFDEDYVAFHRPSGKTHFLNAASHLLVCEILTDARDLDAIVSEFVADEHDGGPTAFVAQMRTMLDHLENLGLVERV
jgi:PqqD family protein of HPr-rel-A system